MRKLSPRRRRLVALSVLPACFSGAFGSMHQHLAHTAHAGLYEGMYLAGLCAYIAFLFHESVQLRREEGCTRA